MVAVSLKKKKVIKREEGKREKKTNNESSKDYDQSDNQGHMFIKITNDSNSNQTITINKGDGFAQGIFIPFGITMDDMVSTTRNGGFGSTDGKEDNA